jgi:hypothetical protein
MTDILKPGEHRARLIDGKAGAAIVDAAAKRAAESLQGLLGRAPALAVVWWVKTRQARCMSAIKSGAPKRRA